MGALREGPLGLAATVDARMETVVREGKGMMEGQSVVKHE